MLYTIGHSNHHPEAFAQLLKTYGIEALADVRSSPFSRHFPHFNAPELKKLLKAIGIRYVPMGSELGGGPRVLIFTTLKGTPIMPKCPERRCFDRAWKG